VQIVHRTAGRAGTTGRRSLHSSIRPAGCRPTRRRANRYQPAWRWAARYRSARRRPIWGGSRRLALLGLYNPGNCGQCHRWRS
jgi:hypothetical protein